MTKPLLVIKFVVTDDGMLDCLIEQPAVIMKDDVIKSVARGLFNLQCGNLVEVTAQKIMDWGMRTGNAAFAARVIEEWRVMYVNNQEHGPIVKPMSVFNTER